MQNWRLDDLISNQLNNLKLVEGLKLVKSRPTTGSLSAYDNFEWDEFTEIFGSANTPRFYKNSFILVKFVQDNNVADVFPGQVQYYLEYEVNLPSELWKNRFYEIGRDSIIPIHHIYSRFIPSKFIVGQRNPVTFMALWDSNRRNCFQFSFQQKFKIKKYETERLIKYLRKDSKSEGLELDNDFFTKLEKKEITGSSFFKLTRWNFKEYGITLRQALELEDYIKRLAEI
ncbi:hypothetical protein RhiirB3_438338 [Rhizophagus irregularis]|nr:hypothetical protein RhiirB3_438338 [Rhizophagus irregularis]